MNIIVIGIQGCGKGTQAALVSEKRGWAHINIGNLLRKHIIENTELGKTAKAYIDKGELVPDELVYGVLDDAIRKSPQGFILDGFPRNLEQLDYLLAHYTIDKVIQLDLSDEIAIQRISARRNCVDCKKDYNLIFNKPANDGSCDVCGGKLVQREDDNEVAVATRLQKFHQETAKVIEKYKELNLLNTIDADQPIGEIQSQILQIIG